jgi:hypothetical protein
MAFNMTTLTTSPAPPRRGPLSELNANSPIASWSAKGSSGVEKQILLGETSLQKTVKLQNMAGAYSSRPGVLGTKGRDDGLVEALRHAPQKEGLLQRALGQDVREDHAGETAASLEPSEGNADRVVDLAIERKEAGYVSFLLRPVLGFGTNDRRSLRRLMLCIRRHHLHNPHLQHLPAATVKLH